MSSTDKTARSDEVVVDVVTPFSPEHTPEHMMDRAKDSVKSQTVETNIIVIEDKDPNGPAWARNLGLERSDNRYVAFLDADDYWTDPRKLKKQISAMRSYGCANTGFCISGYDIDDTDTFLKQVFLEQVVSFTSSIVVDTKQTNARFDEDLYRREDHLFALAAVTDAGVCTLDEDCVTTEKHENGLSASEDLGQKLDAYHEFYEKAIDLIPYLQQYQDAYFWHAYHRVGRSQYRDGEYNESVRNLLTASRYQLKPKTAAAIGISALNAAEGISKEVVGL